MPLYFKDESEMKVNFQQLVIVCPKVYSILAEALVQGEAGFEIHKCKGLPSAVAKRVLSHQKYMDCLLTEEKLSCTYHQIRIKDCRITTETMSKVALSASETKRFWY